MVDVSSDQGTCRSRRRGRRPCRHGRSCRWRPHQAEPRTTPQTEDGQGAKHHYLPLGLIRRGRGRHRPPVEPPARTPSTSSKRPSELLTPLPLWEREGWRNARSWLDLPVRRITSLTCQAFVIIGRFCGRESRTWARSIVLSASTPPLPAKAGALHRLRAEVIERLDAQLPGAEVEHQQVPLFHIGRDEQVQRSAPGRYRASRSPASSSSQRWSISNARLERCPSLPALRKSRCWTAAAMLEDRVPDIGAVLRILRLRDQDLLQIRRS